MAFKYSTGFKNGLLGTDDLKTMLDDGYIKIYSGAVPADADASIGAAVLLNTYSDGGAAAGAGNGLDMDTAAAGGAIGKAPAQTWQGTSVAAGEAAFFRYIQLADTGAASTTEVRIQGLVGGAGADMFVTDATIIDATVYTVDYFSIAVPAA